MRSKTKALTTHELHLHLYGCLSAEDVWTLAKPLWQERLTALNWFADEYEKAWGRRPDFAKYWTTADGLARLRSDFEFTQSNPFPKFQACFNLLIALFPLQTHGTLVLKQALQRLQKDGLSYVELRVPIAPSFAHDKDAVHQHFSSFANYILEFNKSHPNFEARLAISLPRDTKLLNAQYLLLRDWLEKNRQLAKAISAIDFCTFEEHDPPKDKAEFLKQVREDNVKDPDLALAVLYHVGETFEQLSIESSIRWVWQAHAFGAHRLGHCISLGIDPKALMGRTSAETSGERLDHIEWLLAGKKLLNNHGFHFDENELKKEQRILAKNPKDQKITRSYSEADLNNIRRLQDAVLKDLASKKAIIESCPTSNRLIAKIDQIEHHPILRFLNFSFQLVLSSDDPGIFANSILAEENYCRKKLMISESNLERMAKNAELVIAENISGRSCKS